MPTSLMELWDMNVNNIPANSPLFMVNTTVPDKDPEPKLHTVTSDGTFLSEVSRLSSAIMHVLAPGKSHTCTTGSNAA